MAKRSSGKSGQKVRYAFIGSGGIAGAHLRFLKERPEVELVALADVRVESAQKFAEQYNISQTFADYREMLDKVKPDAVSVCTPNGLHCQNSVDALNAGAHVLVEKPMAMNATEAQRMIDAAKKNGRKLVIGFQWRYGAASQFLRSHVEAGKFGDIMYARAQAMRRRGIPNWGVFGRKDLQGGGPMIDIGVHIIEVCHYVMGSPKPVAASGSTFTYLGNKKSDVKSMWPNWDHKTYTVEDLAVGQIRFENGAMLTIESSFVAHCPDKWNFELLGTKAGGTFDPPQIYTDQDGYMVNTQPAWLPTGDHSDVMKLKINNFVDHVAHNKPSLCPAEHGLMVQKMLDGIYQSAAVGKEVAIK